MIVQLNKPNLGVWASCNVRTTVASMPAQNKGPTPHGQCGHLVTVGEYAGQQESKSCKKMEKRYNEIFGSKRKVKKSQTPQPEKPVELFEYEHVPLDEVFRQAVGDICSNYGWTTDEEVRDEVEVSQVPDKITPKEVNLKLNVSDDRYEEMRNDYEEALNEQFMTPKERFHKNLSLLNKEFNEKKLRILAKVYRKHNHAMINYDEACAEIEKANKSKQNTINQCLRDWIQFYHKREGKRAPKNWDEDRKIEYITEHSEAVQNRLLEVERLNKKLEKIVKRCEEVSDKFVSFLLKLN